MQNNVTELTDKLLRALDTNYNVTDMQTVINIIVLLDKVAITKEVLEATRLGKHVNELRRNTSNDWLAKRAKELVKKWRNLVLAPLQQQQQQQHQQQPYDHSATTTTNNGQMKQSHAPPPVMRDKVDQRQDVAAQVLEDIGGGTALGHGTGISKKRSAKERLDTNSSGVTSKRPRILNGGSELDLSDTSNSSFHDVVLARNELRLAKTSASSATSSVILINSDSNSSIPEYKSQLQVSTIPPIPAIMSSNSTLTPPLTSPSSTSSLPQPQSTSPALPITAPTQQPTIPSSNVTTAAAAQRRRGRRKGSSAHRNLLDEADASFNSKMARGANARVKTTQELVASLSSLGGGRAVGVVGGGGVIAALAAGGKSGSVSGTTAKEDLVQKAAKLTERVVEIDQKLNTNANRYKNNGGSTLATTTTSNKHHHHYRHNNNNIINSLSNNLGTYEGDDEDVIVVDEVEVSARQQERRHRKRRDSAAMRGVDDNVIEQEKEVGQSLQQPPRSLDTALALSLLPPIDRSFLNSPTPTHTSQEPPNCSCRLTDNSPQHITATIINKKHSDFSIGGSDDEQDQNEDQLAEQQQQPPPPYEWEADDDCLAGVYLQKKYRLGADMDSMVDIVHERYIPGVNCNTQQQVIVTSDVVGPSSDNVVPDVYRDLQRKLEAYKPYSISEIDDSVKLETDDKDRTAVSTTSEVTDGDNVECREFHEILDMPSYNGEMLRILPYVIID